MKESAPEKEQVQGVREIQLGDREAKNKQLKDALPHLSDSIHQDFPQHNDAALDRIKEKVYESKSGFWPKALAVTAFIAETFARRDERRMDAESRRILAIAQASKIKNESRVLLEEAESKRLDNEIKEIRNEEVRRLRAKIKRKGLILSPEIGPDNRLDIFATRVDKYQLTQKDIESDAESSSGDSSESHSGS